MIDLTAALPAFVVTLREGFEAALVVGIVLAFLEKAQQSQLRRWVYQGIGGGIVASIMLGLLLAGVFQGVNAYSSSYASIVKEILAALFGAIAIAMLSWMLIWMTQQARSLKSNIEGTLQSAIAGGAAAKQQVFLLVFIAVVREGFETVLFLSAQFQDSGLASGVGAIAGLLAATGLGFLLFKWGVKIDIRRFFWFMGILLLLIVGGLVIGVLKHLDASLGELSTIDPSLARWCIVPGESCLLGDRFWDLSSWLPDKKFPGLILKSLFGYRDRLYWGQAIAYSLFLVAIGGLYGRSLGQASRKTALSSPPPNPLKSS